MMNDIRYLNCLRLASGKRPHLRGDRLSFNDFGGRSNMLDLSIRTCENRGGKLDFQLQIAPAGSNLFVRRHLFREWF